MVASFNRFSWWPWGGRGKEPVFSCLNNSSSTDWDSPELRKHAKNSTSQRKLKKKWQSREERRIDEQCGDVVLVASNGGVYLSATVSDVPEWSIGWVEAHGPEFAANDKADDGFAVLVPCYRSGCKKLVEGSNNQLLSAIRNLPNGFSSERKNYTERLSFLQNFQCWMPSAPHQLKKPV